MYGDTTISVGREQLMFTFDDSAPNSVTTNRSSGRFATSVIDLLQQETTNE